MGDYKGRRQTKEGEIEEEKMRGEEEGGEVKVIGCMGWSNNNSK